MRKNNNKVLLTGGHAGSTAYALISKIKELRLPWKLYFIGGKSSVEGKKTRVLPAVSFSETDVEYYDVITGRLQRKFTRWTIPSLIKIPLGFIQSFYLIIKIDPDVVVSFGGYAAFPVVVTAWMLRKKIIIHEQTAAAGRANIYSARFADQIAISRESSKEFFPKHKTVLVGNPISPKVVKLSAKEKISDPPTIFITGGASGSKTINNNVDKILEKLLERYRVIHQTGDLQIDHFKNRNRDLSKKYKQRYQVRSLIPSAEWPSYLKMADIIVSRAGANIVSEIIHIKRPAILIPLPFAYLDEQLKNARTAKEIGIAEIIQQDELDPEKLFQRIKKVHKNWHQYVKKSRSYEFPDEEASEKLISLIKNYL